MASESSLLVLSNFIGGEFKKSSAYLDSFDPSTGQISTKIPDSGIVEVDEAVLSAKNAFKSWSKLAVSERSRILLKVADIIESELEEFAIAESKDQGKPLWLSKTIEIPRVIQNFRHFAQSALNDTDDAIPEPDKGILNYTVQTPVGIAAIISPWNLPLYLLSFKLAPALVYGNTVVAKPSEFTSVTAWMLCNVVKRAGLPAGVFNVVFGLGNKVGEPLVKHKDVSLISFTGSTVTGTRIAEITAHQAKKLSLEMGGKNSAIVFDDANLDISVEALIKGSFLNSGQVCLATSRIYVQRKVYDSFSKKFIEAANKLNVGPSTSPNVYLGPVASKIHLEKIKHYLEIAKKEGAIILTNERSLQLNKQGYFLHPVVLTNLGDHSRCMQEEIFGPVTVLSIFDSEDEVIDRANDVPYGLCASIFSENASRLHRVAPQMEVGTVWCNCWLVRNLHMPFGGVKMSGIGREGTKDSRKFYTETKAIVLKY